MFNRSKVKSRNTHTLSSETRVSDEDALIEKLQSRVKEQIDYKTPNPFIFFYQATKPVLIAIAAMVIIVLVSPDKPAPTIYAGKTIPSQIIEVGTILYKEDAILQTMDYALDFPQQGETTLMIVWDYAVEDGDMVSVIIDGKPIGSSFTILHSPHTIKVPKGTNVEVVGTHDGGGGITYAVNFPEIQKTIMNGLTAGETNNYTLNTQTQK